MDTLSKIEQILTDLEDARKKALKEFDDMDADIALTDARYRHLAREVKGQLLKLAIDASISMAKVMEPLTKDQSLVGGVAFGKKELLEALEEIDKKGTLEEKPMTEAEVAEAIQEEIIDESKILQEINDIIDVGAVKNQ